MKISKIKNKIFKNGNKESRGFFWVCRLTASKQYFNLAIPFWYLQAFLDDFLTIDHLHIFSFETWLDVERITGQDADKKIVQEEQQKNILSMLHQVS